MGYEYWYWMGTIYLLFLVVKDLMNRKKVDDRHNWFMLGCSFFLLSYFDHNIVYMFSIIILIIIFYKVLNRLYGHDSSNNIIGGADVSTLSWIFMGYAWINVFYTLGFFVVLLAFSAIWMILVNIMKKYVFRNTEKHYAYYPVIFASFVLHNVLINAYLA